jgi:hypothetical protein
MHSTPAVTTCSINDSELARRIVHIVLMNSGLPTFNYPSGDARTNESFELSVRLVREMLRVRG